MNRTPKALFLGAIATLITLFSFTIQSTKHFNDRSSIVDPNQEGTSGPKLTIRTKNTNGQLISATVKLTKGTECNQQLSLGEWITDAFEDGIHQIDITEAGYVSINTSFDAQGEEMTLEYTLIEE